MARLNGCYGLPRPAFATVAGRFGDWLPGRGGLQVDSGAGFKTGQFRFPAVGGEV